jgi:PAS domain S-box-containing protein
VGIEMLSMKFYFDKRVFFGFLAVLTIIIWLGVSSFLNSKKFAETSKLVAHTNEVLFHAEQLLSKVIEMETNQRGYVLTFDADFLEPIHSSSDTLEQHSKKLRRLIRDNSSQQRRLDSLHDFIIAKRLFIDHVISARKISFDLASDSIQSMRGKYLMERIVAVITAMKKEERILLQQRVSEAEINFERFSYALSALLATTAVILILVFVAIHISLKARSKSESALRVASTQIEDLYENAPCGYYSLNGDGVFVNINKTLLTWLHYEKYEVINQLKFRDIIVSHNLPLFETNFPIFKKQGFINNLEFDFVRKDGLTFPVILNSTALFDERKAFVKSRSVVVDIAEIKKAQHRIRQLNEELEAFAYSVSHDLRSPLRSIDGYTKILEEEYGPKLDEEGNRLMQTIVRNAKRMGQLIDDLLNFSRIGRKDIVKASFDTDALVRSIINEQMEHVGERQIKFNIHELHKTFGDSVLLRQVWENLISNAIKYTRKSESAIVEIGSYIEKNEVAFYVKDNGVGFDMNYSHKLFGVFQRLHKIQDFEGTGVGLAIVYRVVMRHGGRVWAESKINEGATFTFTVPDISTE